MIGFTTRTLAGAITRKEITLEKVVDWAIAERFDWLEIRDITLALGEAELGGLASTAARGNLRLHYAWDGTNILDPGDRKLFLHGVKNAAVLGPETFVRLTIAAKVIRDTPSRLGYTSAELAVLVGRIREYIGIAAERNVQPVFENSHEPLTGRQGEAGISELLAGVPSMNITFDPGNAMDREHNRSSCSASEVKQFYRDFRDRIPYIHLKMTRSNIVLPEFVEDGDLEPAFYRQMVADRKLVCIELSEAADLQTCVSRILKARRLIT